MAWEWLTELDEYTLGSYTGGIPGSGVILSNGSIIRGSTPCTIDTDYSRTESWNIDNRLVITLACRPGSGLMSCAASLDNVSMGQWSGYSTNRHLGYLDCSFAIDESSELARVVYFCEIAGIASYCNGGYDSHDLYLFLKSHEPVLYNWQSVPSISGKNGILNLSQIASASINDGEAVSGASASAFDSLTAQVSTLVTDDSVRSGADAGGISGSGSNSGNQSSGYAFGQGESGTNLSGGGSGLYGGNKGGSLLSGGAGSGYIGNSLVSNKKMVGYNVPTSSAEGTKTESVNEASANPVSGKPKIGNGFARIKMVEQLDPILLDMINEDGFFWKDWSSSIVYGDYDSTMTWNADENYSSYTWVTDNATPVTTSDYKTTTGGVAFVAVSSKATLFISKDANGYTGTIACGERIANQWRGSASIRFQSAKFAYKNGSTQWSDWPGQIAEIPSTLSYTSETLNGVLEYFAKRLRNIYIA